MCIPETVMLASPGSLLETQKPQALAQTYESEPAFQQDPQVNHMHIKMGEKLVSSSNLFVVQESFLHPSLPSFLLCLSPSLSFLFLIFPHPLHLSFFLLDIFKNIACFLSK